MTNNSVEQGATAAVDTTSNEDQHGHDTGLTAQEEQASAAAAAAASPAQRQYSVFTPTEKKIIIVAGSVAGFFSPLTGSIYFPALNTIADDLHVSTSQINLTVTTYLILQGIAPMMIAGFSDNVGRRPAYMLSFSIYIVANLGLGLQSSYAALLVLRCVQSAGSSGTVALANGLVGDTVTSEERGRYMAFASLGGLLGPSISPIIGGAISQSLDWHWIFWFLLIVSVAFCIPLFLFLPETCRRVVGDGSIPPPLWNRSWTDAIRHRRRARQGLSFDRAEQQELLQHYRFQLPNPMPTLRILLDPESIVILVATGLTLACFYAVSTGAPSAFKEIYGFDDIQIALMFVPIGAGGILSAMTTGRLIDWNYRRHARLQGITITRGVRQDLAQFPVERARIEVALPFVVLCSVFLIGYGWVLEQRVSLAGPVVFLFLSGYTTIAAYQTLNVLMTDIWPGKAAAATAANNFVRCELGAAASAAIEPMSRAMGRGWAFTCLALIYLVASPSFLVLMRRGMAMRAAKTAREERRRARERGEAFSATEGKDG